MPTAVVRRQRRPGEAAGADGPDRGAGGRMDPRDPRRARGGRSV